MVSSSDSNALTLDYGSYLTLPFGKGRMALTYDENVDGATLDDAREERRRIMISLGLEFAVFVALRHLSHHGVARSNT